MRKMRLVTGYLFGLALVLVGLTSAAIAQITAPKGNGKISFVSSGADGPFFYENAGIFVLDPDGSGRVQLTFTERNAQSTLKRFATAHVT